MSFVTLCWVAHRALQAREACVSSSFIAYVHIGGHRADNCRFESRLGFSRAHAGLSRGQLTQLRALEALEPMAVVFTPASPYLSIEISGREPRTFALGKGAMRIGEDWLSDARQLRRALIMAVIKQVYLENTGPFQLEVLADFLGLALYGGEERWLRDIKFSTAAPSLARYCKSPLRSLAHARLCDARAEADESDPEFSVWGFRPLLASALYRAFVKLPLKSQMAVLRQVRSGVPLPDIAEPESVQVTHLAAWFQSTLREYALSLGLTDSTGAGELELKRVLKEIEVEAPTHWELTIDLTQTPAWKEIVEQLKARSRYRAAERALVFTPEGELALPSGLPVEWSVEDVQSQKHVLIACHWPAHGGAVHVRARRMFAEQTCDKLNRAFWD